MGRLEYEIYKKNISIFVALILVMTFVGISVRAQSVEVAPRISDREIVQNLADIKADIKVVNLG